MKKIGFNLSLLAVLTISAAPLDSQEGMPYARFETVNEIVELYRDGQYEIVKAKLVNQGFKVISSEPDYSLNGTSHEGTFKMAYEDKYPSDLYQYYWLKRPNYYYFSTTRKTGYKKSDINIVLNTQADNYNSASRMLYNEYFYTLKNKSGLVTRTSDCLSDETCAQILGDISGVRVGYVDNISMSLGYANHSAEVSQGFYKLYSTFRAEFQFVRRKKSSASPTKKTNKHVEKKN